MLRVTEQIIHALVEDKQGANKLAILVVYGLHTIADRKLIWQDFSSIHKDGIVVP